MTMLPVHRLPGSLFPDLGAALPGDMNDVFTTAFAPPRGFVPFVTPHQLRMEDFIEDGHYVLRVEIPDIDPARDLEVTVQRGHLTITAERSVRREDRGYSEFGYGSFARTVALPEGAREDEVSATYGRGILTVRVGLGESPAGARRVDVERVD
ncbi:HSP20 family molecular chaperone IbpA [Nocardia transvalensis]|uniref:HSP20 family molecular chaperone IbpA n=1 Tax=Nocardia transvalensis TaxID=37333 RepID=A0A7W9UKM6_9NOCA|nr:Hsp20/alpha crystallin family protein [Nocardia transvalensis]MBB5916457.1 HSP20 family molecular chaperone IbpA [Nocardia transvalensis]